MLKKWLLVLTIPLFFQLVFLGLLFKSQADRAEAQRWAIHTKETLAQAETIYRLMVEARGDVMGRLVTGGASADEIDALARQVPREVTALRVQVSDNPSQRDLVDRIGGQSAAYLDWLRETDRAVREGKADVASERFQEATRRRSIRNIRALITAFLATEEQLDRQRQADLRRATRRQAAMIYTGAILSLAVATGLILYFSRGFARRIAALAENARRLAEGKILNAPIGGTDEIGQLAVVFDNMARVLAEREQENEMFIYSVSHDLRSPLVNLQGFSKELTYTADDIRKAVEPLEKPPAVASRIARLLDKDMPDSIHYIQNAVSRLSGIIDSLLRLSRAGKVEYRMQALDMDAIVARVVVALRSSIAETGAEVAVDPLPPAWGDPTAVEQIFGNLLSNAVKYLDPSRPGRIEVGAGPSGDDGNALLRYHVRDNGLGFPADHQKRLFLAFQRLHPGVASGEGVGLALARRMVERHGGKIWAESEAGVGSTFFVTLPPTPTPATAPISDPQDETPTTVAAATGARE